MCGSFVLVATISVLSQLLGAAVGAFVPMAPSAQKLVGIIPRRPLPRFSFHQHSSEVNGVSTRLHATSFERPRTGKKKNDKTNKDLSLEDRFDRTASTEAHIEDPCILTINGLRYNITAWANAHPGGVSVLKKFHEKDATKAFEAAGHSEKAHEMLKQFIIIDDEEEEEENQVVTTTDSWLAADDASTAKVAVRKVPRWRAKLFTEEDPRGVHKIFGVYSLLHFLFRFGQMYFGDPSSGLGSRLGKGASFIGPACVLPHAVLSLSSLIFHTVPKERVVGKPMIWQEYRVHNIVFGLRSVVASLLCWLSIYKGHAPGWRQLAVVGSCLTVLAANWGADEGTRRFRANDMESTTATMPYWEGCSVETQRRFKSFYAYCQFLATLACLAVANPAWCLAVLLPIQLASLLMTLVRKGLISAKGYHIGYTISLIMPYFVALRSTIYMKSPDVVALIAIGWALYQLRRRGVDKYALWSSVAVARIAVGDRFINYQVW